MSLSFKVEKEHLSNGSTVAIAYLSGFIDIRTVKIFESESLNPLLNEGSKFLILNFSEVGYMNSTGLGVLVKVRDKYKDADGDLILVNVPQKILDLFKMLGMDTLLQVKKTNQEALESLPFPLLPQIPDIPADSSEMLMESGDLLSPPPMNIPSNAQGGLGNIFMTPDDTSPSSIVIPGGEETQPSAGGLEFPAPDNFGFSPASDNEVPGNTGGGGNVEFSAPSDFDNFSSTPSTNESPSANIEFPAPDNFGGFNPFEVTGEDSPVGEATSLDQETNGDSGITISGEENEFTTDNSFTEPESIPNGGMQISSGIEITEKSPGISDTWEATVDESGIDSTPVGIDISAEPVAENIPIHAETDNFDDDDDDDDDDDFDEDAISELDISTEDDLDDIVDMEEHFRGGMPPMARAVTSLGGMENIAPENSDLDGIENVGPDVSGIDDIQNAPMTPEVSDLDGIQSTPITNDLQENSEESAAENPAAAVGQISDIVTNVNLDENESSAEMAIDEDFAEEPQEDTVQESLNPQEENIAQQDNEIEEEEEEEIAKESSEFKGNLEEISAPLKKKKLAKKDFEDEDIDDVSDIEMEKADSPLTDAELKPAANKQLEDSQDFPIPAHAISPNVTSQMPEMPSLSEKREMEDIVEAVHQADQEQEQEQQESAIVAVSGTTEKMEQQDPVPKVETYYKRKVAVRYYEKMNPLKSFPLLVAFSKEKLQRVVMEHVAQQTASSPIKVKKSNPEVTVTPSLKGCMVYPPSMTIDISPEMTSVEFWITPVVEGDITGHLEISYDGKTVEKIDLSSECVKQTWAKVSAVGAIIIPMVSFLLEGLDWNLPQTAWNLIPKIVKGIETSIGLSNFGLIMGILSIITGSVMYSVTKPKEAEELEKFFSTN